MCPACGCKAAEGQSWFRDRGAPFPTAAKKPLHCSAQESPLRIPARWLIAAEEKLQTLRAGRPRGGVWGDWGDVWGQAYGEK